MPARRAIANPRAVPPRLLPTSSARRILPPLRALVDAGCAAAERRSDQRTALAVDNRAHARTRAGAAANHQRALAPRPARTLAHVAVARSICRTRRAVGHARHTCHAFAGAANDGALTGAARDDHLLREHLRPTRERQDRRR